jgi:hypothetical protein
MKDMNDLQIKELDVGHWAPIEKPEELNEMLVTFVEGLKI